MRNWTRAALIAITRVLVVVGLTAVVVGLFSPVRYGGDAFFGGLACLSLAMLLRYVAGVIWWIDRESIIRRTNWRPYVWFA